MLILLLFEKKIKIQIFGSKEGHFFPYLNQKPAAAQGSPLPLPSQPISSSSTFSPRAPSFPFPLDKNQRDLPFPSSPAAPPSAPQQLPLTDLPLPSPDLPSLTRTPTRTTNASHRHFQHRTRSPPTHSLFNHSVFHLNPIEPSPRQQRFLPFRRSPLKPTPTSGCLPRKKGTQEGLTTTPICLFVPSSLSTRQPPVSRPTAYLSSPDPFCFLLPTTTKPATLTSIFEPTEPPATCKGEEESETKGKKSRSDPLAAWFFPLRRMNPQSRQWL